MPGRIGNQKILPVHSGLDFDSTLEVLFLHKILILFLYMPSREKDKIRFMRFIS